MRLIFFLGWQQKTFLGAEKLETGVWKWNDGSLVNRIHFSTGEPSNNGDCLQIYEPARPPAFDDTGCTYQRHYACERNT